MNRYSPGKLGALLGIVVSGVGFLFIGLGYNGMASNTAVAAQMPYLLSGGILGLALVVFGTGLMMNHSSRENRQRLESVLLQLLDVQEDRGLGAAVPSDADGLFAAGASSYHRPDCRLVDGREEVTYVTADEAHARDLKPCRVCQPDAQPSNVKVR